jgi:hypothetical protein
MYTRLQPSREPFAQRGGGQVTCHKGIVLCAPSLDTTISSSSRMNSHPQPATYHGHRQRSYYAIDTGELVELRARQRTFDNAYLRTCLVNLSYSAVILKLFDSRFYNSKHSTPLRNTFGLTFCPRQSDYSMLFLQHYCWSLPIHGVVIPIRISPIRLALLWSPYTLRLTLLVSGVDHSRQQGGRSFRSQ